MSKAKSNSSKTTAAAPKEDPKEVTEDVAPEVTPAMTLKDDPRGIPTTMNGVTLYVKG